MNRHYQTSDSPFYDKDFAAQPIHRKGHPTLHPTLAPDRYSNNISCRDCQAPARIETHPTKTNYRCIGCQKLLATTYPAAHVIAP